MAYRQLIINPGSTSTKIAVFDDDKQILEETLRHTREELAPYNNIIEQFEFRKNIIETFLEKNNISLNSLSAVIGRGGLLHSIPSGTFTINDDMVKDLKSCKYGEHASNLGGIIAKAMGDNLNIPSYIVDPVVVDEMMEVARVAGHPDFERISIFHALNQKAVARKAAENIGKKYNECNIIVAHLGGGISVGLHNNGEVIDVNNALDGEGPFTPERSGTLPAGQLVKKCFSGKYDLTDIKKMLKGKGGLMAYYDTNDAREVRALVDKGDKKAETIYKAMAYQISKSIMSLFAGVCGKVDAIALTGGIAYDSEYLVKWIKDYCGGFSKFLVFPGEEEMSALALGGLRVLKKEEEPKNYKAN